MFLFGGSKNMAMMTFLGEGTPCSLWDLSPRTRDHTGAPCSGKSESQPLGWGGLEMTTFEPEVLAIFIALYVGYIP